MKSPVFLFLASFITNPCLSQSAICDSLSKEPIQDVLVLSVRGTYLGISDFEGKITWGKTPDNSKVVLSHISFVSDTLAYTSLSNSKTIYLKRKDRLLHEVLVKPNETKYTVLNGYFRSYEYINDIPAYFTDGICEYYISKNGKMRVKTLQFRTFGNKSLINTTDEEELKGKTVSLSLEYFGMPNLSEKPIYEERGVEAVPASASQNQLVLKMGDTYLGRVTTDTLEGKTFVNVNRSTLEKKDRDFLGYKIELLSCTESEIHNSPEFPPAGNEFLSAKRYFRNFTITRKSSAEKRNVQVIKEFYLLNRKYKNEMDIDKNNDYYRVKFNSSFNSNYWEEINVPQLPEIISTAMKNKELTLYQ